MKWSPKKKSLTILIKLIILNAFLSVATHAIMDNQCALEVDPFYKHRYDLLNHIRIGHHLASPVSFTRSGKLVFGTVGENEQGGALMFMDLGSEKRLTEALLEWGVTKVSASSESWAAITTTAGRGYTVYRTREGGYQWMHNDYIVPEWEYHFNALNEYSPDGKKILYSYPGANQHHISIDGDEAFELRPTNLVLELGGTFLERNTPREHVTFSADSNYVIGATVNGKGSMWNVTDGRRLKEFETPTASLGFSQPIVVSSREGNYFYVYAIRGQRRVASELIVWVYEYTGSGNSLQVQRILTVNKRLLEGSPNFNRFQPPVHITRQRNLLVGGTDGVIEVYDLQEPNARPARLTGGHGNSPITAISSTPDGTLWYSGSLNGDFAIWRIAENRFSERYRGTGLPIRQISVNSSNDVVVVTSPLPTSLVPRPALGMYLLSL